MTLCSLGAELFRKGGRTDRQTDRQTQQGNSKFFQFGESALKLKKI